MPTTSLQQLTRAISETVSQFHALMIREIDSLSAGEYDALPALTDQKLVMAEKLDLLERERQLSLEALGHNEFGAQAMNAALQACEDGALLQQQWQQTVDLLADCSQLNAQASALLQAQTQYTQRALEVLAGGASMPVIYGPDGHNGIRTTGTRLGKA